MGEINTTHPEVGPNTAPIPAVIAAALSRFQGAVRFCAYNDGGTYGDSYSDEKYGDYSDSEKYSDDGD